MLFGLIRFPESTCHQDSHYILEEIFEQEVVEIWYKDEFNFQKLDALIISGGVPDNNSAVRKDEPVIAEIVKFAKNGGFVLGIGYGFQLLCNINLLPGEILPNENGKFCCKNVFLKPKHTHSALTAKLNSNFAYKIPISTYFGRYNADDEVIKKMRENQQILFQYCTSDGQLSEHANPNGSRANIAAICNAGKNVYGIMPHPEHAADDELGNTDGIPVFESILAYLK